jgi:hypothetical protein
MATVGKGFYTFAIENQILVTYGTHKGGRTIAKSREVSMGTRAATMITVPSGGLEFEPLEVEFEERIDDDNGDWSLETLLILLRDWNKGANKDTGRHLVKPMQLKIHKDPELQILKATYEFTDAWCMEYTWPEGDRSSDERRKLTAKFSHRGSTVAPVAGGGAAIPSGSSSI